MSAAGKIAIEPTAVYTTAEVARILDRSTRWMYVNRKKLVRMGFPRPVVSRGAPLYSGADLIAWLVRPKFEAALRAAQSENVIDARERLRENARKAAHG